MTPDPATAEPDADLLAACDEAIGAGDALPQLPADSGGLARVVDCLYRLNQHKAHRTAARKIGRFQVLRELGRGGFGVVYLAYDPRLGRDVALKVPRPEVLASDELRERFHREARAAAGLDHPNVVPVYEAGEAGPACYIAAAYCPGPTLREWLGGRTEPTPVADAAALVGALAEGAGHAHTRGVVHRDLKPANVLLAGARGEGRGASKEASDLDPHSSLLTPKITDFGLAKLADPGEASTRSGAVLGTPSYMAPEQAEGRGEVGPAADVYALGVILYECLTGRPPFVGETDLDTLRQSVAQDPVPPSRLRLRLPRDLETVCLKCLEKEPARRYPTAVELAADLRRFLAGEPVTARRVGAVGRAWKRARQKPVAAGLLAAVVALAVGGTAAVTVLWRQAEDALAGEAAQRRKTEAELAAKLIALARVEWEADNVGRAADHLHECPEVYRDREWRDLDRKCRAQVAAYSAVGRTYRVAYSPDGRFVAAAGETRLTVWDVAAGREAFDYRLGLIKILSLGFSPDSRRLLLLHPVPPVPPPLKPGESDPTSDKPAPWRMLSWDTATGRPTPDSPADWSYPARAAWANSPAGLSAYVDGPRVRITDLVSGKEVEFTHGQKAVTRLEFNVSGRHLLSSVPGEPVKVWECSTGRPVGTAPAQQMAPASFPNFRETLSPDGRLLVRRFGALNDGRTPVGLWDVEHGREAATVPVPNVSVSRSRFSPDGRHYAVIDGRAIRLWDLTTRREAATLRGHTNTVIDLAFGPGGRRLSSVGWDQTVRVWDVSPFEE